MLVIAKKAYLKPCSMNSTEVTLMKEAFMSKIDIKHAFRICPVHLDDWPLLVYWWNGKFYVDVVLLFGGRSSPLIYIGLRRQSA